MSARSARGPVQWRYANPTRLHAEDLVPLLEGTELVVVRLLGGRRAWEHGLERLLAGPRPVVVLTGEQAPDAELMGLSTVPAGVAAQAHAYLAHGGPANLAELAAFLSDTVLLTGEGFEAPASAPSWGRLCRETARDDETDLARVAVLYYRAHHMSGNTDFVHGLCDQIERAGGRPLPIWCSSLREAEPDLLAALAEADAIVATVLAAGGTRPAEAHAGGDEGSWDAGALAALDRPILQALCLTSSRAAWQASDEGLSPLDAASQIAVPEFDGRIITVPFSFKEIDADGLPAYVPDPERAARVAGLAVAHARLRHVAPADHRAALVLSAYPTKHARIGNAVGLDTSASAMALLRRMRDEGWDLGPESGPGAVPGLASGDGDELIRALIDAGGYDENWLTDSQLATAPVRIPAADYERWYAGLPDSLRADIEQHWGPPPGELFVDRSQNREGDIVLAALQFGNLLVLVQPPRGFGENPIAIYHDPDLPPSHHYLAAYRWIAARRDDGGFGADAVVHLGKHGNLEWLPGKNAGLSAECAPDAALGNLPLVYPFLVNDPGEGTQAKRRAHAVLVDHLVPPMARAESYGDIARLEQLLDEHASVATLDPAKLPAIRARIWTLLQAAKMDRDLGLVDRPDDERFDDMIMQIDGWLCEIKDAQIRDGLHVLGQPPAGDAKADLVLAILRARQVFGGSQSVPGLREALGLDESATGSGGSRAGVDQAEAQARELIRALDAGGWTDAAVDKAVSLVPAPQADVVRRVLDFAVTEVVPRLDATTGEIDSVIRALRGGYVEAGPSGSPLRGLVSVLPTGRNFYSVDPKAIPSQLAWETGQLLAESLLRRHREDTGDWPTSVGLSLWGTSAMRTAGDDIAEVLALLGIRPLWDEASRRITGIEPIPLAELGRPRIDTTLRISGFFRDAFPHVIALIDDAVQLAASLDEPASDNYVRAHVQSDLAAQPDGQRDERRATTRIFGSRPGTYGAGLLQLIDSKDWRTDADLAEVYTVWGGYAYGRGLEGAPAREAMETAYRRIAVAAKNTDTREHDIADSDDYFQYHGGMVATVRALTGQAPSAYIGDSTRPETVRTRSLHEETSRVFRARVVNPRWMAAMRRHGYKGAFEMAATVDYLFGYDATTGVVDDWMYERLTQEYVLDETNREFLAEKNPWALHGMVERLLEATSRGLWAEPDPAMLAALQQVYLETEGDLEGGEQ